MLFPVILIDNTAASQAEQTILMRPDSSHSRHKAARRAGGREEKEKTPIVRSYRYLVLSLKSHYRHYLDC